MLFVIIVLLLVKDIGNERESARVGAKEGVLPWSAGRIWKIEKRAGNQDLSPKATSASAYAPCIHTDVSAFP